MPTSLDGVPLLGERVSLELANTAYAVRGRPAEGLPTALHLADWLRTVGFAVDVEATDEDLQSALTLRTAIRAVADSLVREQPVDEGAVAVLNRHAATPARWNELSMSPTPHMLAQSDGGAIESALGAIAADAIALFGGPDCAQLRACGGPGCVLFFLSDGRREWCSHGCGNRARAARHYAKNRKT